jgi:hypothetical protein
VSAHLHAERCGFTSRKHGNSFLCSSGQNQLNQIQRVSFQVTGAVEWNVSIGGMIPADESNTLSDMPMIIINITPT